MGKPRRENLRQVLARNVRIERDKRVWTHEQLAEAALLSTRQISIIESGLSDSRLSTLSKLSAAFRIDEEELLDRSTVHRAPENPQRGRPRSGKVKVS